MTKKSKEATVELKPIEIVEKVLDTLVVSEEEPVSDASFDMDKQSIPFLKPYSERSVSRPYRQDVSFEGIVEVAGKTFTGRDITDEEVRELGLHAQGFFGDNDVLTDRGYSRNHGNRSYHHSHVSLKARDVKFKHYHIAGIDLYISNGSKFVITQSMNADLGWEETTHVNPKLIILASELSAKSLVVSGKVSLKNASVTGDGALTLIDSSIDYSTVCGSHQYSTIDDSHLYGTYLHCFYSITITDSDITGASISGLKSVTLDRASGGHDFNVSLYDHRQGNRFSFRASNQYLHPHSISEHGTVGKDYEPVSDIQGFYEGEWTLTLERRIDYGLFAAVKPIAFMRINQCDLLVGDQIFSVKDFFPEFVTEKEPVVSSAPQYGYQGPSYSIGVGGHYNRETELWKRAAKIAFGKPKAVIGKSGEVLVNSLLDQIKSRINLHVEISTVVG